MTQETPNLTEKDLEGLALVSAYAELQDFVETRNFKPEDIHLLADAMQIPRKIYLDNHNTFITRERVIGELQLRITHAEDKHTPETDFNLRYARLMHEVATNYDWATAWNLNVKLEKIAHRTVPEETR